MLSAALTADSSSWWIQRHSVDRRSCQQR